MEDSDAAAALREAGLRVTKPRQAVFTWLDGHPHSTVDAIAGAARRRLDSVSTQAVYDVLAAFTTAGLVRRIELPGQAARFERRAGDNHHHVVCRRCGRAEDVDCVRGAAPCLTPSDSHGFTVDEAEVVFWGVCPDCAGPARAAPDTEPHHHEEMTK